MTDEWIKKMWSISQPLKETKKGSFVEIWMNLESVILSEVSQKNKYHIFMNTCGI